MNIESTKKHYKVAPTFELLELTSCLDDLQPEAIPLLYSELETRHEADALKKINYYLEHDGNFEETNEYDIEDLRNEINERLFAGETIENIKFDIKERIGNNNYENLIDILIKQETIDEFQFSAAVASVLEMNEEHKSSEEKIEQLKSYGLSERDSKQIVNKSLDNMDELVNEATEKIHSRAKKDVIYGVLIIIGVVFSIIIQVISDTSLILVTTGLLGFGIILLMRGVALFKGLNE